ncbi:hypothetical protein BGZ98_008259 [Dissophora globulifera]|nr:hypothetical protein BGZ98_008259 [Dissophora globulifera]
MTRIHARLAATALATLGVLAALAAAQADAPAPFACDNINVEGRVYNISAFKPTTFTIKGEPRDEHPSKIRVDYQLNPCQAIVVPEGEEASHCKAGAWVCQDTKQVPAEGDPKTIFLRAIAGSAPASDNSPAREVAPSVAQADKLEDIKEVPWNLTLKGGVIDGQDQSAVITFICDMAITDEKAGPALTKYENGIAYFSWKSSFACPRETQLPLTEGMSGFSVFLIVVSVFAGIYLVSGAFYNYKVYGSRGIDLIPHIDFWREFPALVVDVVRHVWDSVTGRTSSGRGYVSV